MPVARRRVAAALRAGVCAALCMLSAACDGALERVSEDRNAYPHAHDSIGSVREIYDGTLTPELAVQTFRNIDRLFPTRTIAPAETPRALPPSGRMLTKLSVTLGDSTISAEQYFEHNRVAAVLVLHEGRIAYERYRYGNGPRTRWMSMSVAKSITSTLIGAALRDGAIKSLDDAVTRYVPSLAGSAYDGVSVRQVLTMTSGVRWSERYTDPTSDRRRLLEAQIAQQPGGALAVMRALPRAAAPGSVNTYSTGETQIAGEIVRAAVGRPLADYLSDRIWTPAGMADTARWWLDSPDGIEIGGSGISATLRDYARFGQFILDDGIIGSDTVLPRGWVREATAPTTLTTGQTIDYGYLWWPATTDAGRRDHAFSAVGIHGQLLYVNPAARVVIVSWGAHPEPGGVDEVAETAFIDAVVESLRPFTASGRAAR